MTNRTLGLDDRLHAYLVEHTLREHALLRELREETAGLEMGRAKMEPALADLPRLAIDFNRTQFARLKALIDFINAQ